MKALRSLPVTVSSLALLTALFVPHAAQAESMDYGALQDLFGEPVTVSATGTPQRASDVAANMTIITADEIRRAGSRDIARIVAQYVPGMDLLQAGNGGYEVGVRGYQQGNQPRLLVLVDGRQVFIDDYSRTIWNNIPVNIDDIRQIEVVKGPASALFGSNAAAGAINIVTYSASHDNNRVATLSGGTQGAYGADATLTHNGAWGGIKLSAGSHDAHTFTTMPAPSDAFSPSPIDPYHRYFAASSVLQPRPELHVNLEYTWSESAEPVALPTGGTDGEIARTYSLRGGFDWKTKLGTIVSDTYYNHSMVTLLPPTAAYMRTDLLVSKLEDRFTLGAHHTFRVMFEYRNKKFASDSPQLPTVPIAYGRLNQDVIAVGGSWLWQITDALSWTNAVRLDHVSSQQSGILTPPGVVPNSAYDRGIDAWSANTGLAYKAGQNDTLRLTYGRGIILPSGIQSGLVGASPFPVPGPPSFIAFLPNPVLSPTVVQNAELGEAHRFAAIDSILSASVFYSYSHDVLGLPFAFNTPVLYNGALYFTNGAANIGGSRSLGTEIELKGQNARGFHWDASYSYVHVKDQSAVLVAQAYSGSTPEHHVRLSGGYAHGPWEFDANIQYLSSHLTLVQSITGGSVPVRAGGYVTVGGRAAYTFAERYTVAVIGTELNYDQLQASALPRIERQVLGTLTAKF